MEQGHLPLWTSDDLYTYTELDTFRKREYKRRGHTIVQKILAAMQAFEESTATIFLSELNQLTLEIGALNPAWLNFSTDVFRACLIPSQNSAETLRNSLTQTLSSLPAA